MAEIGRDTQVGTALMSRYYNPLTGETYESTGSLDTPPEGFIPMDANYTPGMGTGTGTGANATYDPYAYSDIGRRALGGEYIDAMNFFWFDPVTGEEGQTTEGWSRVPDYAKPYTYLDPASRNQARNTFYESGAAFGGTGGFGGGMGGLLSGQAYAQQIAGGMPFEQVVAPGMSFSPDQPMGYIAEGATPFQPRPAFFPSVQDPSVGMTGADLGLPMGAGTPMPAGVTFDPESIRQIPAPQIDIEGLLADVDVDELLKNIGLQKIPEPVIPEPTPILSPITTPLQVQEPIGREIPEALDIPVQTLQDLPLNLGLPMTVEEPRILEPVVTENLGLPQINIPQITAIQEPIVETPTTVPLAIPEVVTPVLSAQAQEKMDRLSKNMIDAMGITVPQTATLATAATPLPASQRTVELPTATNLGISPFGFINPVANVESIVAPLATNKVGMIRER